MALAAISGLRSGAQANMPPPQHFASEPSKDEKSKAVLVVQSGCPFGVKQRIGSEYDTQGYCHVVLDFEAQEGAKGQFTLRGSATGYIDVGAQGPFIDEIAPVAIDVTPGTGWMKKSIFAPLRHDVTFFEWTPAPDSTGSLYVWATAIPCGLSTEGFAIPR